MADCQHRQRRLVISFPETRYQIQCRECLLTGPNSFTGMQAYVQWLALLRTMAEAASKHQAAVA